MVNAAGACSPEGELVHVQSDLSVRSGVVINHRCGSRVSDVPRGLLTPLLAARQLAAWRAAAGWLGASVVVSPSRRMSRPRSSSAAPS